MKKEYTTKAGHDVKIFTLEASDKEFPVVGEMFIDGEWIFTRWTKDFKFTFEANRFELPVQTSSFDLVECIPYETATVFVYEDGVISNEIREEKVLTRVKVEYII